jgi:hypothetical protein
MAAASGTCTLLNSGPLFKNGSPAERYQQGWTVLFIYFGCLIFGLILGLTAVFWRSLSGQAWSDAPSTFRLVARRVIAAGFAVVALTMATLTVLGVVRSNGYEFLYPLLFAGLPAGLFSYGAYRAWGWRPKASPAKSGSK